MTVQLSRCLTYYRKRLGLRLKGRNPIERESSRYGHILPREGFPRDPTPRLRTIFPSQRCLYQLNKKERWRLCRPFSRVLGAANQRSMAHNVSLQMLQCSSSVLRSSYRYGMHLTVGPISLGLSMKPTEEPFRCDLNDCILVLYAFSHHDNRYHLTNPTRTVRCGSKPVRMLFTIPEQLPCHQDFSCSTQSQWLAGDVRRVVICVFRLIATSMTAASPLCH